MSVFVTDDQMATEGVLKYLREFQRAQLSSIDRYVFRGYADWPRLCNLMDALKEQGLVVEIRSGTYRITDDGLKYIDEHY